MHRRQNRIKKSRSGNVIRLTALPTVQLFDEFPLPAGGQLEPALVVVRRPVGPAHRIVDVRARVLAVATRCTRLAFTPGYTHAPKGAHTVITATAGF